MISIIILFKNRRRLSEICLKSIIAHTNLRQCELIGVDAGSTDGLLQCLQNNPFDTLISLPKERDVHAVSASPEYFRRGLAIAHGEIIVKMDGDIFVWNNWLEPLIEILHSDAIGISSYFFCGSGEMADVQKWGLVGNERKYANYNYISTDVLNGGIWVMKRSLLDAIGGYQVEKSWGNALDSCISKKVLSTGKELAYLTPRRATHVGGQFPTQKYLKEGSISDPEHDKRMLEIYPNEMKWFTQVR